MAGSDKKASYAHLSREATAGVELLAAEIRAARKMRRYSESELAARAGVSRDTVRAIEAARPSVAIGLYFEVASILGLELFGGHEASVRRLGEARTRLSLLPERVRASRQVFDDDF
jgi:transcriptional regulator with XRE-family HTH domain